MKKIKRIATVLVCTFLLLSSACCFLPLEASASSRGSVSSVAINLSMPPVNAAEVTGINVTMSSGGCYISSVVWYDIYGQAITDRFDGNSVTLEVIVTASSGNRFSGDVAVSVAGQPASYDNYGTQLYISKSFMPMVWAPTMVKHPGSETIPEGGMVSFVAYASCVNKSEWHIMAPDGSFYSVDAFADAFPGIAIESSFDKLNIGPIPMELDGYKVCCKFTGPGGTITSSYATITVEPRQTFDPNAALTPAPTPVHEHVFSTELSHDAGYHWYACECGETQNKTEHDFVWTQKANATADEPGSVQGECRTCGYTYSLATELDPVVAEQMRAEEEAEAKAEAEEKAAEEKKEEMQSAPVTPKPEPEKKGLFKRLFSLFSSVFK